MAVKITYNRIPVNGETISFKYNGKTCKFTYVDPSNYSFKDGLIDISSGNYGQGARAAIVMPLYYDYLKVTNLGDYPTGTGIITLEAKDGLPLTDFVISGDFAKVEGNVVTESTSNINPNPVDVVPPSTTPPATTSHTTAPPNTSSNTTTAPPATTTSSNTTTTTATNDTKIKPEYWLLALAGLIVLYVVVKGDKKQKNK